MHNLLLSLDNSPMEVDASESLGGLLKRRLLGPPPRVSDSESRVGTDDLHF